LDKGVSLFEVEIKIEKKKRFGQQEGEVGYYDSKVVESRQQCLAIWYCETVAVAFPRKEI
jgi:hypothetical protein